MKLIHCLLLLLPAHLYAQTDSTRIHSVGLFGEANAMFNSSGAAQLSTVGLQYHKQGKKNLSWSINVGYGSYNSTRNSFHGLTTINGDTARSVSTGHKADLCILGFGVEVQRKFYRKLYFVAGGEIRAGYGIGTIDTDFTKAYNINMHNPTTGASEPGTMTEFTQTTGPGVSMFYAAITPYIGLKVELKRFTLGTSFMNYFTYTSAGVKGKGTDAFMDFDFSNFTQRFYVAYKF